MQAQLLALVQVRRSRQGEHQQRSGPGPAETLVTVEGRLCAVGQQPRLAGPLRPGSLGSPYRVACRTTSWLENTQVEDAPVISASARLG